MAHLQKSSEFWRTMEGKPLPEPELDQTLDEFPSYERARRLSCLYGVSFAEACAALEESDQANRVREEYFRRSIGRVRRHAESTVLLSTTREDPPVAPNPTARYRPSTYWSSLEQTVRSYLRR